MLLLNCLLMKLPRFIEILTECLPLMEYCFNHESPRRGETFVTRKISKAVGRIHHGIKVKFL